MPFHVAIGALLVECNHFGGIPTDLESFKRTQYLLDDELLQLNDGTIGGYLEVLAQQDEVTVVPTVAATACPGGLVTDVAYGHIKKAFLSRIQAAQQRGELDGVLLALHGSAASESHYDLEGDILQAVHEQVGGNVPIVATLDLHAHITQQMLDHSDVLIAWETYPHRDARETGMRGAQAIADILHGKLKPTMAMGIAPVLVGAINGTTDGEPCPFRRRIVKQDLLRAGVEAEIRIKNDQSPIGNPADIEPRHPDKPHRTRGLPDFNGKVHAFWRKRIARIDKAPRLAPRRGKHLLGGAQAAVLLLPYPFDEFRRHQHVRLCQGD